MRIDSPRRIISKPSLIFSCGMTCVIRSSMLILPSMYQSTMRGTSVRPRTPPKAFGGVRGRTEVPRIVDWYMDGKINIDDLITHVMPHEKINEGFEMMRRGESIRTVLTY